jgi:hypothetical protein
VPHTDVLLSGGDGEVIERALFVTRQNNLGYADNSYQRLYYGNEFCEQLIPSAAELGEAVKFALNRSMAFTLVTPYVTESGLDKLKTLFRSLQTNAESAEVVFNDWGVFRILRHEFPQLTPVMGRLMNKMKRGPRLMVVIDKLPETTVEYFRNSSLVVPPYRNYLLTNGIGRVELDNPLQGVELPLGGFNVSLYVPFAYVSTSRICLTASCDKPNCEDFIGIFPCHRECRKYTFGLSNEIMPVMLIRKGNTIFFENQSIPVNLEDMGISRLVVQPELPM